MFLLSTNAEKKPRFPTTFFSRAVLIGLSILLVISMTSFYTNAADPTEDLAQKLMAAIEGRKKTVDITIPVGANGLNQVIADTFLQYPTLFYYYDGYNSTSYTAHTNVTFKLHKTDVPWEQVYLVQSMQDLKNALGYALSQYQTDFHFVTVNGSEVTGDDINDLAHEIRTENYLSYMGYQGNTFNYTTCTLASIDSYDLTINYWEGVSRNTLAQWRDATEQKASQLANTLFAQDMPDYMKELRIHDWLVNNCRYNTKDTSAPASHMAYSGLVSGNPVCQGYAEAALVLFQAAGIPAYYVPGDGTNSDGVTESHGWNCVQIQGDWYMLDITWDDPTSRNGTDTLRYDYFNVTSSQLAKDHRWERNDFPNCSATRLNYSTVQKLVDNDTSVYSDYSDRNLPTRSKAQAYYGKQLRICAKPGSTASSPTEPTYSEPSYSQPDTPTYTPEYTYPDNSTPEYTYPSTTGNPGYSTTPSASSRNIIFGIVGGVIAAILAGLGGLAAIIIALFKRGGGGGSKGNGPRTTFDPTDFR